MFKTITQARALERLSYDAESGNLPWISAAKNKQHVIGQPAGRVEFNGYWHIKVDGKLYAAHRLIWLMVHGCWPLVIDHVDGIKTNNRLTNLRNVDAKTNAGNRHGARKDCKAGTPGVYHRKGRWYAYAYRDGVKHSLGGHPSIEFAAAARTAFKGARYV